MGIGWDKIWGDGEKYLLLGGNGEEIKYPPNCTALIRH